ncbi:hypothetical protein AR158_c005L [Paramecium bursaria Chlorella virus AR158]|uniref:hypothetical protein n=1 Tax=Paramecium bursaria Chlorella virus AR158 TaxID=380598 RepID=UPI00015AA709|nr:hypothetical protein AR158_c005L [Paramecium bursaria Chlorella virus AR158]ABU43551.1 hypothetical protein AR158_c005L [Paramecium bursaria Chlorella virus AR158]
MSTLSTNGDNIVSSMRDTSPRATQSGLFLLCVFIASISSSENATTSIPAIFIPKVSPPAPANNDIALKFLMV